MPSTLLKRIESFFSIFIAGLVISGATAIPRETELKLLVRVAGADGNAEHNAFAAWLLKVRDALVATNARHPFIAYGTDWLAFAHFVIAIAFIGPWRDPVQMFAELSLEDCLRARRSVRAGDGQRSRNSVRLAVY